MTISKRSHKELILSASEKIFSLERKIAKEEIKLEDVGDIIPGNIMVQDFKTMTNTFMNKSGCESLGCEAEELKLLGPDYYEKFFIKEEIDYAVSNIIQLLKRGDETEAFSFFQRVKSRKTNEFSWYFCTTKVLRRSLSKTPNEIVNFAFEANNLDTLGSKMAKVMEEDSQRVRLYPKFVSLTKREKELIRLLSLGYNNPQISDMLYISRSTVEQHRKNIYKKLELKSFSHLIRFAILFDLVDNSDI